MVHYNIGISGCTKISTCSVAVAFCIDLPVCSGETQLTEGQETNLTCASNYSGNNQPKLKWFRGDSAIPSKDEYEIRLAKQKVQYTVSYRDDKQRFTCQMLFGNQIEECMLFMDVTCELNLKLSICANGNNFKCSTVDDYKATIIGTI